ncbi:MAG: CHASE2 domain-containing protein, partial [Proteobacteria bacterium]|nr:CHASE2 domain-containing protein [Pseudomonadota bacterium]
MRRWLHIVVPLAILIFSIGLRGADPFLLHDGRLKVFDLFQVLKPRLYEPTPVRLIDLDDESLARLGQWPWPRNLVA